MLKIKVKICGITRLTDGLAAAEAGAAAIGLVFYPKSPRYIEPKQAADLIAQLPPLLTVVGLFVNTPTQEINQIADFCRLDAIQLHGDESPEGCRGLNRRVIKALRIAQPGDLALAAAYPVSALLLDAKVTGHYGGTGESFDWGMLTEFTPSRPWILAGGLTPENVGDALRRVRPYAVDLSSGVESAPGVKDPAKIRKFFAAMQATLVTSPCQ